MQHKYHYTFILLHFRPHHTIFNKHFLLITLLQGLAQVEEMLIAAVMPIMSIYRLPHGRMVIQDLS